MSLGVKGKNQVQSEGQERECSMGAKALQGLRKLESDVVTLGGCRFHDTLRGSTPSFFMRAIRVVRLRPMRAAAPSAPATRPLVIFKMRTISSRSFASRVPATGVVLPLLPSSAIGACSARP